MAITTAHTLVVHPRTHTHTHTHPHARERQRHRQRNTFTTRFARRGCRRVAAATCASSHPLPPPDTPTHTHTHMSDSTSSSSSDENDGDAAVVAARSVSFADQRSLRRLLVVARTFEARKLARRSQRARSTPPPPSSSAAEATISSSSSSSSSSAAPQLAARIDRERQLIKLIDLDGLVARIVARAIGDKTTAARTPKSHPSAEDGKLLADIESRLIRAPVVQSAIARLRAGQPVAPPRSNVPVHAAEPSAKRPRRAEVSGPPPNLRLESTFVESLRGPSPPSFPASDDDADDHPRCDEDDPDSGSEDDSTAVPRRPALSKKDLGRYASKKHNRMGQRARRALWEQQYGNQARHLKHATPQQPVHRSASTTSKSTRAHRTNTIPVSAPVRQRGPSAHAPSTLASADKVADAASAHPSWNAVKQRREQEMMHSFAGSKKRFDDDD
jgi:hypothetical protein